MKSKNNEQLRAKMFDLEIFAGKEEEFKEMLKEDLVVPKSPKKSQKVPNSGPEVPESPKLVMTPNPEQIVLAEKSRAFKGYLQLADYLIPDGMGLVWASKYLRKKRRLARRAQKREGGQEETQVIKERIAGADIVKWILEVAEEEGLTVLVVGGFYDNYVVSAGGEGIEEERAREKNDIANIQYDIANDNKMGLIRRIRLKSGTITNWLEGYQNVKKMTAEETGKVRAAIARLRPEVVLVAFGAPEQERWLIENREWLGEAGVRVGMSIGGSVDFLTGKTHRAPEWWQKMGLEWLFRLMKQPWRAKRQVALVKFLDLLSKQT